MRTKRNRIIFFIIIALSFALITGCSDFHTLDEGKNPPTSVTDENLANKLRVHFIDVGQADCILIEMPDGKTALIDGGNRDDRDLIVQYIKDLGIRRIDFMIATHPHEDHIGGLPDVVRTFDIGAIYMPEKSATTKIFENLLREIDRKELTINIAKGKDVIYKTENLEFTILAPNSKDYGETNEYSIVNKLSYKNTSFLFTGDAEKISEDEMLSLDCDLRASVLKVGHHGGRTSTSSSFLSAVNPQYAIISVSNDNDYGHPHSEVIERLKNAHISILRTDILGTIKAVSDGEKIVFNETVENEDYDSNNNIEKDEYYIGNRNTFVYHSPTCGSLPNEENQIKWYSKEEAEKNGYRPHKTCIY